MVAKMDRLWAELLAFLMAVKLVETTGKRLDTDLETKMVESMDVL